MNLSQLKKSSSLDKLTKAVADTQKQSYAKDDERFWQPEVDKAGNGYAVIRFLDAPAVDGEDALPWVQLFSHGFQGSAGWYIENCPTTVQGKCPVCEHNNKLWNSGIEANKEIVRKQKRKLGYVANIVVISDAKRPENEGKVFLYRFGKKIFDKINEKLSPQFEDETAINPFDFWKGANFKVKIRQVEGFRNYDKSEFDVVSPLFEGDDKLIEKAWKASYSLKEFVAADQFKPYEELRGKLDRALGAGGAAAARAPTIEDSSAPWDEPRADAPRSRPHESSQPTGEDDDDLSYFDKLAKG